MKGRVNLLTKFPLLILSVCSIVASSFLIKSMGFWAWALLIISICVSIILFTEMILASKNIKKYILNLNKDISCTEKESLYFFPAPTIIIDDTNSIVWYNKQFSEKLYFQKEAYGININDITDTKIDNYLDKIFTEQGIIINHIGRYYRILGTKPEDESLNLSMIYFEDVSDYKALEKEHLGSKPTVVLIMIDNFDDLLSNVKESEKATVLVKIEKLLENFMEETTGVIRKISNDRFIAVIEERHLSSMINKRFDILDKARAIMVNERLCVTLSIGVGRGGHTMFESEKFAKQALDMSLGRGGDQCSVKTENGFEFFGGVSKGIEKHAKVKTRIIATAMTEIIETSTNILIMGHKFGDLDSIGSAVGLCAVMKKMGKAAFVVVDHEKNLAKVLIEYIKENDINDMFITPEVALNQVNEKTLLVIVDTHNPDFVDCKELYEKVRQVVVIDHHRKMVNYIDNALIFYHEPYASSASEMVAELIQYFGDMSKISAPEAEALLSGIMLDTKNFVMRTGVRTFEAAAFLRKLGADTVAVRNLFASSIETYQQKSNLIANAEVYHKCAIATTDLSSEEIRIAAPQAADELLGITGVDASFVIFLINGIVNISARSLGAFNVQLIMEALGGGGHQTMAGAQLEGVDIEAAKHLLLVAIDEFIKKTQ